MIATEFFREKFGHALSEFVGECPCSQEFYVVEGELESIVLQWTTPHDLRAEIMLALWPDGFEVNSLLERQTVRVGRMCSWTTPSRKLMARLREGRSSLDSTGHSPLWSSIDTRGAR